MGIVPRWPKLSLCPRALRRIRVLSGIIEVVRRLAVKIEYDGTRYNGFQWQRGLPTIQGELEVALMKLTGEHRRVIGASRTDAGVHAREQVVVFTSASSLSLQSMAAGMNSYLPEDIVVTAATEVGEGFRLRGGARSREYRYTILNRPTPSPFLRRSAFWIRKPLAIEAMQQAASFLPKVRDFAPFTIAGGPFPSQRNLYRAQVDKQGEMVYLDMEADAFLPQQVRRTAGAIIQVGLGRMSGDAFQRLASSQEYGLAGPVVPAHGLCLMKVNYDEDPFCQSL